MIVRGTNRGIRLGRFSVGYDRLSIFFDTIYRDTHIMTYTLSIDHNALYDPIMTYPIDTPFLYTFANTPCQHTHSIHHLNPPSHSPPLLNPVDQPPHPLNPSSLSTFSPPPPSEPTLSTPHPLYQPSHSPPPSEPTLSTPHPHYQPSHSPPPSEPSRFWRLLVGAMVGDFQWSPNSTVENGLGSRDDRARCRG